MAGRARRAALADELTTRAREWAEWQVGDEEPSHLEYVADCQENGKGQKKLCAEISETIGYELTPSFLGKYLREMYGEEAVRDRLSTSRLRASHLMAEESVELVDAEADTQLDVNRAMNRARTRQWLASRYNPKDYGQEKGANVVISIGGLHLDALRARPAQAAIATVSAPDNAPLHTVESQPLVNAGDTQAA